MGHSKPTPEEEAAVLQAKRDARSRARQARDGVETAERAQAAEQLARLLLTLPELLNAKTVLAYAALPSELDPAPAIWMLRRRGVRIAYPRIEAPGVLGMHCVDHEVELVPGPFGLAQPSEHAPHVAHDQIDAIIVPGVAFDEQGNRLGYGGGYYDRLLPMCRVDCRRIGIGFDEQVIACIPAQEHDAQMDLVVTPKRVIRPEAARRF
jgi:5-formyltetrahydrofolate cyclo-ligase